MGEKHEMTKNVIKACAPSECICVRVGMGTRVHSPKNTYYNNKSEKFKQLPYALTQTPQWRYNNTVLFDIQQ